jgi:peroxiredoxin Q/BCP
MVNRTVFLALLAPLALSIGCKREATPAASRAQSVAESAHPSTPVANPHGPMPAAPAANSGSLRVDSPARDELIGQGQEAPRFRATAHDGRVIESAGRRDKPLVVYFYPRDETPGCTVEAEGFRDAAREFEAAGVDVVGVSTDSNEAHRGFATSHQLGFALVSDPDGRLASAFGVGVRMGFAQRITFVIDRTGSVGRVFDSVTPAGHATQVLAAARGS